MKSFFLAFAIVLCCYTSSYAQYHATYRYTFFDSNTNEPITVPIGELPVFQEYYVMNGYMKSVFDGSSTFMMFMNNEAGKKYIVDFEGNIEEQSENDEFLRLEHSDSIVTIQGKLCNVIKGIYNNHSVTYFYPSEGPAVDPESLKNNPDKGGYELNKVMNGRIPLKFIIEYEDKTQVAELIEIEKLELTTADFNPKIAIENHSKAQSKKLNDFLEKRSEKIGADGDNNFNTIQTQGSLGRPPNFIKCETLMDLKDFRVRFIFEFGGKEGMIVQDSKRSWNYDPFNDVVSVKEFESPQKNKNAISLLPIFSPMTAAEWSEYQIIDIRQYDSLLRIVSFKNKEFNVFYFDDQYLLVQTENHNEFYNILGYKQFNGVDIPTQISLIKLDSREETVFIIEEVKFNVAVSDSLFDIPKELMEKITSSKVAESVSGYLEEAESYTVEENYEAAIASYKAALKLKANSNTYNELGLLYLIIGDNYAAITAFSNAIDYQPNFADYYYYRAKAKQNIGDYISSIKDFNLAISLDEQDATYFNFRGLSHYRLKKYDSALFDYKRATQLDSTYAPAFYSAGFTASDLGRYEEALVYFNKNIELGNTSANVYNKRGVCLYRIEKYEKAVNDFKRATKSKDVSSLYYVNLGNAYYQLEEFEKAKVAYEGSIELDSTYASGYVGLGNTYMDNQSYQMAIVNFSKAIKLDSKNAQNYEFRGHAKYRSMDYLGAIEDYSRSISLYPDDHNIYFYRGQAKLNVNDRFDACKDFKVAVEMGNEDAIALLEENCGN